MSAEQRCGWCGEDPLYVKYHDEEWGVPLFDDRTLFEFLVLEGAQAGLSWITILRKREGYRQAFHGFDIARVAAMTDRQLEKQLQNPAIVRNRLKVFSARTNARAVLTVQETVGSLSDYFWQFVDHHPIQNSWKTLKQVPATSRESDALSKDMKKRGFSFVGSTIMYAFMQATGMVNDHTVDCFRHHQVSRLTRR